MGILDTILGFFKSTTKDTRSADRAVKQAQSVAQSGSYNQASIQSFYALEKIGEQYGEQKREPHITAREYASQISETGLTTSEELEPIILNFEVAKYAESDITSDDYGKVEEALNIVHRKFKSGRPARAAARKKGTAKRRRRPKRGATTGASRKRKAKPRKRRTRKR